MVWSLVLVVITLCPLAVLEMSASFNSGWSWGGGGGMGGLSSIWPALIAPPPLFFTLNEIPKYFRPHCHLGFADFLDSILVPSALIMIY